MRHRSIYPTCTTCSAINFGPRRPSSLQVEQPRSLFARLAVFGVFREVVGAVCEQWSVYFVAAEMRLKEGNVSSGYIRMQLWRLATSHPGLLLPRRQALVIWRQIGMLKHWSCEESTTRADSCELFFATLHNMHKHS